ncbi:hypothetical protein OH76DRAFT_445716 [Lentinus brumalis]|uniref:Uncharacterized protein n=1 Tax=Lentinus brumalis TaxID=2498619 RepID=A0A371DD17_9APHY|nr:hypothetical protein OH76DRAFT_445716 [Polyporus brumalis]
MFDIRYSLLFCPPIPPPVHRVSAVVILCSVLSVPCPVSHSPFSGYHCTPCLPTSFLQRFSPQVHWLVDLYLMPSGCSFLLVRAIALVHLESPDHYYILHLGGHMVSRTTQLFVVHIRAGVLLDLCNVHVGMGRAAEYCDLHLSLVFFLLFVRVRSERGNRANGNQYVSKSRGDTDYSSACRSPL